MPSRKISTETLQKVAFVVAGLSLAVSIAALFIAAVRAVV